MPRMTEVKRNRARELRKAMTPAERLLWGHLRRHCIAGAQFRRQHVIRGFVVDFYCHAARLIVEVDGPIHAEQRIADEERDAILVGCGYLVVRVSNAEVLTHLDAVLDRISRLCKGTQDRRDQTDSAT